MSDYILFLVLETAVTIGISALSGLKGAMTAISGIKCLNAADEVAGFDPVGTDVLHRTGTDLAGDERQVFSSCPPAPYAHRHEVIPAQSGTCTHIDSLIILCHHLDTGGRRVQHQSVIVAGEEQIAATAYVQPSGNARQREYVRQVARIGIVNKLCRPRLNAECIVRTQLEVTVLGYHGQTLKFSYL